MEKANIACIKCSHPMSPAVFFCPACGTANLSNLLREKSRTTANYDPNNPERKPWKEEVKLSAKPWALNTNRPRLANDVLKPWRPPMKAGIRKIMKKKNSESDRVFKSAADLGNGIYIFKPGQPFHDVRNREKPRPIEPEIEIYDSTPALIPEDEDDVPRGMITDVIHPIGIYEGTWIFPYVNGYNIYISLLERSQERRVMHKEQFLRIGAKMEVLDDDDDDNEASVENELFVIDIITNDVGRLLTPPDKEWVALDSIDPHEYYMGLHMQNILVYIAKRVNGLAFDRMHKLLFDQHCVIENIYTPLSTIISNYRQYNNLNLGNYRTTLREYCEQQVERAEIYQEKLRKSKNKHVKPRSHHMFRGYSVRYPRTNKVGPVKLSFENTIIATACRIQAGAIHLRRYILCTARLSVLYYQSSPLLLPLPEQTILQAAKVSHLCINLFPMYSDLLIKPKKIVFHVDSLESLLGSSIDINHTLQQGPYAVVSLLKRIASICRYEYTPKGVKLMVNGAFNEKYYKIRRWPGVEYPEEEVEEETEDSYFDVEPAINVDEELAYLDNPVEEIILPPKVASPESKPKPLLDSVGDYFRDKVEKAQAERERLEMLKNETETSRHIAQLVSAYDDQSQQLSHADRLRLKVAEAQEISSQIDDGINNGTISEEKIETNIDDDTVYEEEHMCTTKEIDGTAVELSGEYSIQARAIGSDNTVEAQLTIYAVETERRELSATVIIDHETLVDVIKYSILPVLEDSDEENEDDDDDEIRSPKTGDRFKAIALIDKLLVDHQLQDYLFRTVCAGLALVISREKRKMKLKLEHTTILLC